VMFIPRFHEFSNVVARGHHLRLHYEAGIASHVLPGVKNKPQSTKIAGDDGTISIIVTKCVLGEEGRRHPRQQDSQPLPRPLLSRPVSFFVSAGLPQRTSSIARGPKNIDDLGFRVDRTQLLDVHISPQSCCDCPANRRQRWITLASACR
jgi:hypothetical protein